MTVNCIRKRSGKFEELKEIKINSISEESQMREIKKYSQGNEKIG